MSRVFIVRHGNTFGPGEPPRRIGARSDLPLTEEGREQAAALGRHFAASDVQFTLACTSPLLRCRDTASEILRFQMRDIACTPLPMLAEIEHGPDEGQLEARVIERIGRPAIEQWDAGGEPPDGWIVDAEWRIDRWREWLRDLPASDVLAVTSNGAARFALRAIGEAVPTSTQKLSTGAYGVLGRERDGRYLVEAWNVRP